MNLFLSITFLSWTLLAVGAQKCKNPKVLEGKQNLNEIFVIFARALLGIVILTIVC